MAKKYPYQQFSLTDLEGEQWNDIPFLDGAYRISNYGRVKTMRRWVTYQNQGGRWLKERIRKPVISTQVVSGGKRKLYRLSVYVKFEGQPFDIGIARMVYYLFVEKFDLEDRTRVITCKDGDPFNIQPDNLQRITSSASITRAYRKNHRPLDSFNNKASKVSQYSLQGQLIKTYPSITAAANACGMNSSGICEALKKPSKFSGNCLWKQGEPVMDRIRVPAFAKNKLASDQLHATIVSQYDLHGKKIREYPTLKEAARSVKSQPNMIRQVILGNSLTAKGYFWLLGKGPAKIVLKHLEKSKLNWKKKICRPITQYDLVGKRIRTYPSQAEAARQLKVDPMIISSALRSERLHYGGGFFWRYGKGPVFIEIPEHLKRRCFLQRFYQQPVTQYDRQGKRIAIYHTVTDAARAINSQTYSLVYALTGKLLTCANCYWRLGKGRIKITL